MKIFKYELKMDSKQVLQLPHIRSEVLSVQNQNGNICFWMAVDEVSYKTPMTFYILGTGDACPNNLNYIGTVQLNGYVWHIFNE